MRTFLYAIVEVIARIHTLLLGMNDSYETAFTDKDLHFLVIGALGMVLVFLIHPFFKILAETGHTMVITWIYVFTLLLVITFAIEIGQGLTGTGNMEFADIMSGLVGFFFMFGVFAIIRGIILGIVHLFSKD